MSRMPLLVLAILLVGGCVGMDNREPPAKLESFERGAQLDRVWRASLGGVVKHHSLGLAPVVADEGRLYAAGAGGRVVAMDMERGTTLWMTSLDRALSAGPAVGEGLVIVSTGNGEIVALDAINGTERWRAGLNIEVLAAPAISRGVVAVRTTDGRLLALDIADGHVMWTFEQSTPALTLRGTARPVILGDLIIAGYDNGRLIANHVRDGQPVWDIPLGVARGRTEVERMVDVNATPRLLGRDLYAVGYQGRIASLSADSGRILWTEDLSSAAGLAVDPRSVFVTNTDSVVIAYDRFDGSELWRQRALRARDLTAPVSHGDMIVVADFQGYLHWLSKSTGEIVARERVDRRAVQSPPHASGDMLFVQGDSGTLTAFRIAR